jgi:acyl dehydratase
VSGIPWAVGDTLVERTFPPVERLDLIRYAGASGDYNPIHTIDEEATRAGLPGIVQHGMLTMARAGLLFSPHLESGFLREFRLRFVGMVFLGEEVRLAATVTSRDETREEEAYGFEITAHVGQRTVARGSAELVVFRDSG